MGTHRMLLLVEFERRLLVEYEVDNVCDELMLHHESDLCAASIHDVQPELTLANDMGTVKYDSKRIQFLGTCSCMNWNISYSPRSTL
jgi:hypothetical protein